MRHMAALIVFGGVLSVPALSADWPQFMRDSAHTGNAADESLTLPLGLAAQVRLDDAVMTTPAVVDGRVYVVDQMGACYAVDPGGGGKIIWKSAPDGARAKGSNTSSPAVAAGRVCYGTTAGALHILDARDGKVLKTLDIGSPIVSSVTFANDRFYFQGLDAVLRCLDLSGSERWTWNHYQRYQEPLETTRKEAPARGHPGSYDRPHYGGGDVSVTGNRVVTSMGWDIFCLEDQGTNAVLAWCRRCPSGRDGAAPMSSSISGSFVYTAGMGADGCLGLMRLNLADGRNATNGATGIPYPWITPAVRGAMVTTRSEYDRRDSISGYDCDTKTRAGFWQDPKAATPVVSSHALARDHLLVTTLAGELMVLDLAPKPGSKPFIFHTPTGRGIGSSPAVSRGSVYFGADDGNLYVLAAAGAATPSNAGTPPVCERRSPAVAAAAGKPYGWTSTAGDAANTGFADDPALKPPLQLRWAIRGFGHFKTPCVASAEGDLVTVTLDRTVTCLEQSTGRMRWRMRLPPESAGWGASAGLLIAQDKLFVPCPNGRPEGKMVCVDMKNGRIAWMAPLGGVGIWDRASPVHAAGRVVYGHSLGKRSLVQAWDADSGAPAWQLELKITPAGAASGCSDGTNVYFTAGREKWGWKADGDGTRGETVAVDASTGKVIWRSTELFGTCTPALFGGDKLFMIEFGDGPMGGVRAVSTRDGSLVWRGGKSGASRISLGPDYAVLRGYGGGGGKLKLQDGSAYPGIQAGGQLGGDTHACGAVALAPDYAFAITVGGLNVRDARTGALAWQSPGFAPRACVNATLSNGRVFWPSAGNGMVYCWEPGNQKSLETE